MINFEQYHNENPHIWEAFVRFANEAKQRGFKKYSANGIFELIRWEMKGEKRFDGFKINNNYRADYARKMMAEFPEFKGFFEIRQLTSLRNTESNEVNN